MHVGEAWTVAHVGTIGIPHTSAPGKQQGFVCTGTCPKRGQKWGGTGLAFLPKVLRYAKPSVPSPEMGFPNGEPKDSMGATGQVSPCGQTPDGGYSVREPAVRAWGDRLRLVNRSASQEGA